MRKIPGGGYAPAEAEVEAIEEIASNDAAALADEVEATPEEDAEASDTEVAPEAVDDTVAEGDALDIDDISSEAVEEDTVAYEAQFEGESSEQTYSITINAQNGNANALNMDSNYSAVESAKAGVSILITTMPDDGYIYSGITISYEGFSETYEATRYPEFTMPAADVIVDVLFKEKELHNIYIVGTDVCNATAYNNADSETPITSASENDTIKLVYSAPEGVIAYARMSYSDGDFEVSEGTDGDAVVIDKPMPAEDVTILVGTKRNITVVSENGELNVAWGDWNVSYALAGDVITLHPYPNEGYTYKGATVSCNGETFEVSDGEDFGMPAGDITITAHFEEGGDETGHQIIGVPSYDASRPFNFRVEVDGEVLPNGSLIDAGKEVYIVVETTGSTVVDGLNVSTIDVEGVRNDVELTFIGDYTYFFTMPDREVEFSFYTYDSNPGGGSGGPISMGPYPINVYGGQPGGATAYIGGDWVSSANAGDTIRLTYDGGTVCAILNYKGETHELAERTDLSEPFSVEFTMPDAGVDITLRFSDGTTSEIGGSGGPSGSGYNVGRPPYDATRSYNIKTFVDGVEVDGLIEPGTLVTVKFETDGSINIFNVRIVIYDNSGNELSEVPSTQLDSLTYTFTMPEANVSVNFSSSGSGGPSGPVGTAIIVNDENFPDKTLQEIFKMRGAVKQGDDYVIYSTNYFMLSLDGVKNFKGLELLTSLNRLEIFNAGETVNVESDSVTSIMFVECPDTKTINLSGCPHLKDMNFEWNTPNVTSLDVTGCTELTQLWARGAALTSLDVSKNTELLLLDCNSNKLTELNVSNNAKLTQLSTHSNKLTELNVSGCPNLLPYIDAAHASTQSDETGNYVMYANDGEYVLTVDKNVEVVTEGVIPPTAKANLTYNGEPQELVVPGKATEGVMEYKVEDGAWSTEIPTMTDSGSYMVEYRIVLDDPEAEAPEGGSVLVPILQKELTLTWEDTEFTYDGEAHKPTLTLDGVIGEDDCTASVTVEGEAANAGDYTATASLETGLRNYRLPEDASVEFTIIKAKHDPVVIADEDAPVLSAVAEENQAYDLTKYLSDTVTWWVESQDGLRVLNAWPSEDEAKPYTLLYTTLAPKTGTETGEVVLVAAYDNYEDLEITVPFKFNTAKYTLAFVTNGATPVASRKLYEGTPYGDLPELTREGYTFDGWYADSELTEKLDEAPVMGDADTQIYAKWVSDSFTVTLELGDLNTLSGEEFTLAELGVDNAEIIYTRDDDAFELPVPKDASKDGSEKTYTFTGWLGEDGGEPQINVTVDPANAADVTYTAQWIETRLEGQVSFTGATETLKGLVDVADEGDSTEGGSTSKLANAMKEIAVRENASSDEYVDSSEVANVTVSMNVSAAEDDISNIGRNEIESKIEELEVAADNTDFLEINIIVLAENEEGAKIEEISGAIEDTQRAVEIPIQYSLVKGEDALYDPVVLRYHGDTATAMTRLSGRPAEGSYQDNTYYVDNKGADSVIYVYSQYFSTFAVAASTTPSYYVTFESNGGDSVDAVKVTADDGFKVKAPEITRASDEECVYSFDGWFTDGDLQDAFDPDQEIAADTKLYAKFTAMPFVNMVVNGINCDADGGVTCDYEGLPVGIRVESEIESDITVYYALEELTAENYTTGTTTPITFKTAYTSAKVYWYAVSDGSSVPTPDSGSVDIVVNVPLTADQKPTAKTLTNTGSAQALVNAPTGALPEGYTGIQYSIDGGKTWSATIPTAKNAGTYTVQVKFVGDDDHEDFEIDPIKVTIPAAAVKPAPAPAPAAAAPAPAPAPEPVPEPTPTIYAPKKSNKATIYVGTVYQIDLAGATAKSYKSSKKKVATVSKDGLVTPKKKGKVKITVKVGKKKRVITLTVKDPTIPTKVYLDMAGTVPAQVGVPQVLTVTLPDGTYSGIKWTSSNKKVATVKNGVVTFKKAGKVTITATATRGKKKAKVKFKVSK